MRKALKEKEEKRRDLSENTNREMKENILVSTTSYS